MGIFRNYFDKTNTIVKNSIVNTANNPITELSFGSRVTRLLIYVNLDIIKQKVLNKDITITPDTRHYLKMTSTIDFSVNNSDYKNFTIDGSSRPTSFDLDLYPLYENWDEGVGYDYSLSATRRAEDLDFIQGPSNWTQATSLLNWATPGAIASGTTAIGTQHFDKGNENLKIDITDFVNNLLLVSDSTYTGFCLKFKDEYENLNGSKEYVTGFFNKTTQTYFEPFIETVFNNTIHDDRNKFYLNKLNRLYLYVNTGGKQTNLDILPTCTIPLQPNLEVIHESKGVYYVEFTPLSDTFISYKKYSDTWSNLILNQTTLTSTILNFIPKDDNEFFIANDKMINGIHYGVSLSGIKQEEKLTSGEVRRVNVITRVPYTVNQTITINEIYYRLYVKLGSNQLTVIDWDNVSASNFDNFFTLDTSWLIPEKYYLDIKITLNGEVLLYNDCLVFNIVNRKNS